MLKILESFFSGLESNQVKHCHWKSNIDLEDACNGIGDLDLLFDKTQYDVVSKILVEHGFKRANSNFDRQFPGMEDYFGYDFTTGKIIHLQVHYQLVTGQPLIKNYHFPIEKLILSHLTKDPVTQIPVPKRELELVLHVCRTFIKLGSKTLIQPKVFSREKSKAKEELEFLMPEGIEKMDLVLIQTAIPYIDSDLFQDALFAMNNNCSRAKWFLIRRKLCNAMEIVRRRGKINTVLTWSMRRLYLVYCLKLHGGAPKRNPATGGFGIAILGSDGAGKSTAVLNLKQWLGAVFAVKSFHMGRPKYSIKTKVLSRLIQIIESKRKAEFYLPHPGVKAAKLWPNSLAWIPSHLYISLAQDRRRNYQRIRQYIGSGGIAICDRYPMIDLKLMDCPRVKLISDQNSPYYKKLSETEESIYKEIKVLDKTLLFTVDPGIAAKRQSGDGEEYVKVRATEMLEFSKKSQNPLQLIDASLTLNEVEQSVKEIVWKSL